ncbi:phosphoribosylaminoimidazole carboxylase ADE2 [Sugiyamaella lignohabitans]|uniref:Phosphoribosylaminoimidazole carboxylase n=1 Tax=Sugiyamaella lignohabitans TaxID=796027 RepID=A0A167DVU6_9ASCO|nr:phosphoribosylaminoimidazole carboxylase ADE2 [Sugiyamaella lignohabitans]ANB13351.1 phosphoribosylaminoimidazole carboxylase ADE2 [Sugiyamaella lignohabitans]
MDSRKVGILGGGQLGRMMVEAAHRLNIHTVVLDGEGAPAKQINALSDHVNGSFNDPEAIAELSNKVDVLTIEIEHVNADILEDLEKSSSTKVEIHPSPQTIKIIKDKYLQKKHLISHGIATADAESVESTPESLEAVGKKFGYPYMLKSRTDAYDGRGNFVVDDESKIKEALEFLHSRPLYAEKWAKFTKELAVMVVRSTDGTVHSYPTVETVQKNNICHLVYAPARVPDTIQLKAKLEAENAVKTFTGAGIFGVEMFLLEDGEIIVNEIAPRPHNSGHYTQDACVTSQFEAHLRSILGLPLPKGFSNLSTPSTNSIMLNILGGDEPNSELEICKRALETAGANVHLYGKSTRPGRKMGHVNIVAGSMAEAEARLERIMHGTPIESFQKSSDLAGTSENPLVSIIMGSDSDLPVMAVGANILKQFGVPFELKIVSAHRTPHRMSKFAVEAASRGVKAIIAGAGGAAHLPGMVAAMTSLPVIGVPVKGSVLDGVDSLHSIVQMPRGVPVATVAINNSTNAALLAIRILGAFIPEYHNKMEKYMANMEEEVLAKTHKIETNGYENYNK